MVKVPGTAASLSKIVESRKLRAVGTISQRRYRRRMRDESPGIPLAEVLRVSNELVSVV